MNMVVGGSDLLVFDGAPRIGVNVFLAIAEDAVDMMVDAHRSLVTMPTEPFLRTWWGWSLRHFLEVEAGSEGEQKKVCLEAQKILEWKRKEDICKLGMK